jgi:hypothetical protein
MNKAITAAEYMVVRIAYKKENKAHINIWQCLEQSRNEQQEPLARAEMTVTTRD